MDAPHMPSPKRSSVRKPRAAYIIRKFSYAGAMSHAGVVELKHCGAQGA
jgi:hypothetical protein